MKLHYLFLSLFLSLFLLASCSSEIEQYIEEYEGTVENIRVSLEDFKNENGSRTTVTSDDSGVHYVWAVTDTIGIFPSEGRQVEFAMSEGAGSKNATFTGGGWGLKSSSTYAAYCPLLGQYYLDKTNIPVNYTGQIQDGNDNTAHLGKFDYLVAPASAVHNGTVSFDFKRLGCVVNLEIPLEEVGNVSSVTLSCNQPIFIEHGAFNLNAQAPEITSEKLSKTFTVNLKNVVTATEHKTVSVYFMTPPIPMEGKTVEISVICNGKEYKGTVQSKNMTVGTAYKLAVSMDSDRSAVHVSNAGSLPALIGDRNKFNITELKVSGKLNGDDIRFIREMAGRDVNGNLTEGKLVNLNLENAEIVPGGTYYYGLDGNEYHTSQDIIGDYMFSKTNLLEFVYPQNCIQIGNHAFEETHLKNIDIPASVCSIKDCAFYDCKTEKITLLNSIKEIGHQAFHTIKADTVRINCDTPDSKSFANPFYGGQYSLLIIGNKVSHLGDYTFLKCDINKIEYESGTQVTYIGEGCFALNNVIEIMPIPYTVTKIGYRALGGNPNLISYKIVQGTFMRGDYYIIDDFWLYDYNLGAIMDAPCNNPTTYLSDAPGLYRVIQYAFADNKNLEEVYFEYINYVEDNAFSDCQKLKTVRMTNLTNLGSFVFSSCPVLENVFLDGSFTNVENCTFSNCTNLKNVEFGSNITHIGSLAFDKCTSLQSITCKSTTPPTLGEYLMGYEYIDCSNITLYVPAESIYDYRNSPDWSNYNFNIRPI